MTELTKLGKYTIKRELGRGAMGVVYEGFDPLIERVVAIKTIRAEQFDAIQIQEILARFKREAQAAGRLNHPNVVGIYEYGEDAGVAYIAMEFIKGRELREYFDAGERFAIPKAERLMSELLGALNHAHECGVVHRDMKPANVIILDSGSVKVADFGIARIETSELTQAGTVMGTPSYMSPEQFLGQPVDGRSDIFSCGVILYQFLTGEKPFTGAVTTIMHKVLQEEPLAPSMLNATLPKEWDLVVKKAMAKKPHERFATAKAFADAIHDAAAGRISPSLMASGDATVINAPSAEATLINAPAGEATVVNVAGMSAPANGAVGSAATQATPPKRPATRPLEETVLQEARPSTVSEAANSSNFKWAAIGAAVLALIGGGAYFGSKAGGGATTAATAPSNAAAPATAATPAAAPAAPANAVPPAEPAVEPGVVVVSALGLADPVRFNGDAQAAGSEARADAKRQLVEKVLGLYVTSDSLNRNYARVSDTILARAGDFVKTSLGEDGAQKGGDGLMAVATRAQVNTRAVQKALNEMSNSERIEFIRNNGDPKISVEMIIRNADTSQAIPPARSQLAENVIKERVKSFGFRVWSNEGETKTQANAKSADFHIVGEVKVKQLSAKLAASGLTITKTAITSWTVKAIDKASGEEIYANTQLPKAQSFGSEDQALAEIGRQVGEEFTKRFFMEKFNFGTQKVAFTLGGLPAGSETMFLRELKSLRGVLDAQWAGGKFMLSVAVGSPPDVIDSAVLKPLNAKLGAACFSLGNSAGADVSASLNAQCTADSMKSKLESTPPAGWLNAPEARSKAVRKAA